jgi:hypothetical protein
MFAYSKRPWSIFIYFFLLCLLVGASMTFVLGRVVAIDTNVIVSQFSVFTRLIACLTVFAETKGKLSRGLHRGRSLRFRCRCRRFSAQCVQRMCVQSVHISYATHRHDFRTLCEHGRLLPLDRRTSRLGRCAWITKANQSTLQSRWLVSSSLGAKAWAHSTTTPRALYPRRSAAFWTTFSAVMAMRTM